MADESDKGTLGKEIREDGYAVELNPGLPAEAAALVYTDGDLTLPTFAKIGDYLSTLSPEPPPGVGPLGDMRKVITPEHPWPTNQDSPAMAAAWAWVPYGDTNIKTLGSYAFTPTAQSDDDEGIVPGAADFISTGKDSVFSRDQITSIGRAARTKFPERQFPLYDDLETSGPGFAETPKPENPSTHINQLQVGISSFLEMNHFNPTPTQSPFISSDGTGGIISHTQGRMGAYINAGGVDADGSGDPDGYGQPVTTQMLRSIGTRLMVAGTGHTDEANISDIHKIAVGKLMLPAGTQLQVQKVNLADIRPKRYLKAVGAYGKTGTGTNHKPSITDSTIGKKGDRTEDDMGSLEWVSSGGSSFGHMNSPFEPFDGGFPVGMIILSLTGMIALMLIAFLIDGIIAACTQSDGGYGDIPGGQVTHSALGRRPSEFVSSPSVAGHYIIPDTSGAVLIQQLFSIPFTRNNFGSSMAQGINSFYGFSEGSIMDFIRGGSINFMQIMQHAENLRRSPGYYSSIMRQVVRDTEQMERAVSDAARDAESADPVFAAFTGIFNVLEAIVTSTTYRFIITMVGMGDQVLNAKTQRFSPYNRPADEIPDVAEMRMAKSRAGWVTLSKGDGGGSKSDALVWRHSSPAGCFILPPSITVAGAYKVGGAANTGIPGPSTMGDTAAVWSHLSKHLIKNPQKYVRVSNRIEPSLAAAVEEALEGEYIPFYFRDLRTNEIVSFHAFLTALGENFTPEWTSVAGLGRIDNVQIYNRTQRTFDISFIVAATSGVDHEAMWWSINKLVAMVYPQYTEGRKVRGKLGEKDLDFTVPFSQVPSASPIIRLRLGDLVKSNLSRFGLKRLFGIGNPGFTSSYEKQVAADSLEAWSKEKQAQLVVEKGLMKDRYLKGGFQVGDIVHAYTANSRAMEIIEIVEPSSPAPPEVPSGADGAPPGRKQVTQVILNVNPEGLEPPQEEITKKTNEVLFTSMGMKEEGGTTSIRLAKSQLHHRVGGTVAGEKIMLAKATKLAEDHATKLVPGHLDSKFAEVVKDLNENFFGDGNFMIKSFEDTAGSGLPGVITSLSMQYADRPWEILPGQRAPIIVEVNMSFTVIHDIAPGLDATGFLQAPTHTVGSTMKNTFGDTLRGAGLESDEGWADAKKLHQEQRDAHLKPPPGRESVETPKLS